MSYTSCWITVSELIIIYGGGKIAPVLIEDRIKKEVPFLSNVMVVGDNRKYLTCLVTIKVCRSYNCIFSSVAISHLHPPPFSRFLLYHITVCDGPTDRKTH